MYQNLSKIYNNLLQWNIFYIFENGYDENDIGCLREQFSKIVVSDV
jgi:hypothetical protein